MPKKKVSLQRLLATVVDIEVGERPKGVREKLRPVSLLVSVQAEGGERREWIALGSQLRLRVKELLPASEHLIGKNFELFLNEDGQIEEFRRAP